jgi:hypothetical protein
MRLFLVFVSSEFPLAVILRRGNVESSNVGVEVRGIKPRAATAQKPGAAVKPPPERSDPGCNRGLLLSRLALLLAQ